MNSSCFFLQAIEQLVLIFSKCYMFKCYFVCSHFQQHKPSKTPMISNMTKPIAEEARIIANIIRSVPPVDEAFVSERKRSIEWSLFTPLKPWRCPWQETIAMHLSWEFSVSSQLKSQSDMASEVLVKVTCNWLEIFPLTYVLLCDIVVTSRPLIRHWMLVALSPEMAHWIVTEVVFPVVSLTIASRLINSSCRAAIQV